MNRDARDLSVGHFALAGVETGAYREVEIADAVDNRAGAANGPGRSVEGGQESVTCGVDLAAAESQQFAAYQRVVAFKHFAPAAVAKLDRLDRRLDDVSEENGRQHPIRLDFIPSAGLPDVGQEPLHLGLEERAAGPERQVADSRKLHEAG